ncbi:MAG: restriction endonuclease subunit S [Sphingopyxis sp.]
MTDWPSTTIGEIFDIGSGKTMSSKVRADAELTPFLRTSNVFWDRIDLSKVDEMPMLLWEREEKSLLPGDLLVCEGGEIGRAAVWEGQAESISFQNHLHRLRRKNDDIDPGFYAYFLQSAFTQLGIYEGAGNKTTIPNLSRSNLAALDVPKPDFDEQRDIRLVLKRVRAAMEKADDGIHVADELKRAAMRELFARGVRGEAQKDSEIGPVPESWNVVEFGSVRRRLQYGTSVRCDTKPTPFPVLRIPNIGQGKVDANDLKYAHFNEKDAENHRLEKGDMIFIRTNGVIERLGCCAVFEGQPEGALFASYLIRAQPDLEALNPGFAAHYFGSPVGTRIIAGRATPAADGKYNLNTGIIDSLPIPLPPTLEEQQEVAEILDAIDAKIELHKRKRAVLEELFRGLLHKLMTGEIRVAELDLSALETKQEVAA